MKGLSKTKALFLSLTGLDAVPMIKGKVNLSEEQEEDAKEKLGPELLQKTIKALEKEAEQSLKDKESNKDLLAMKEELKQFLSESETDLTADEVIKVSKSESKDGDDADVVAEVKTLMTQFMGKFEAQNELIQKLLDEPEGDSPAAKGTVENKVKMKHSKTHLFSSDAAYNAYEGRNWNKRAAGISDKPTNFASANGVEIAKLNDDLDHYYRENPTVITSLHRDNFELPSDWDKKTGVDDQVADGTIVTDEVSQARKLPWLPKNKQKINAEIGKIFPVQIDIEFVGKMLQDLEATWLNKFVGGGSSPYKDSFVAFLVSELDKKARQEDRMSSIKGVYVPTPDDATVPGRAINRQDGLLYQFWKAYYVDKKFRAANIGAPTTTNIVDYIQDLIKANLDEDVRAMAGLKIYMSNDWLLSYKKRYRQIHGVETDFDGNVVNIENYANIKMESLRALAGTDFMFITWPNNIQILEKIPAEKSMYSFEKRLRHIYVLGDYKLGIRLVHIGNKVKAGDPDAFKVQTVWTNGQPMFKKDFFIPAHDNETGELDMKYSNIKVSDGWKTDITELSNTFKGQTVKIKGNTNAVAGKVVKNNANFDLASDFALNSGGTLTLYIQEDGTAKELKRTGAPEQVTPEEVTFNDDIIDAVDASDQSFNGADAVTLTEIINGTEGQELTITATTTGGLTINGTTQGVTLKNGNAVLAAVDDTISFVYVDGSFIETTRTIAA